LADREPEERVRGKNLPPVSEQEWKEATPFLSSNSGIRFKLADGPFGERERLKRVLFERYRSITELKDKASELFKTRVEEFQLEDEVFGICQKLKHPNSDKKKLHEELTGKIDALFTLGLTERKQRISLVEKSLTQQKLALKSDEDNKTKLVNEQVEYVLTHGVGFARLEGGAGHHSGSKSKPGAGATTSPGEPQPASPGISNP
jgi:hypothetical protein